MGAQISLRLELKSIHRKAGRSVSTESCQPMLCFPPPFPLLRLVGAGQMGSEAIGVARI